MGTFILATVVPNRRAVLVFSFLLPLSFARGEPSYWGTYAGDCTQQKEASVSIAPDAIVLRTATGARTLKPVESDRAFYGRLAPPPGFVTMLSVEALPGKALNLEVFESRGATTIELSGHPQVKNSLPASLRKGRLRRCDDRSHQNIGVEMSPQRT